MADEPPVVIETQRLALRELTAGDIDALASMYADPEVMRWIGMGGVQSREAAADYIARQQQEYREHGYGEWAVVEKSTGAMVGMCGLIRWPDIDGREELEVAYLLARSAWGRGLATEAAAAIRDWGLRELGRDRLVSLIYPENVASIAVARKIGMRHARDIVLRGRTLRLYMLAPETPVPHTPG